MGNKNKRRNKVMSPVVNQPELDLDSLQQKRQELEIIERDLIQKSLSSTDPHSIIKAQNYLQTLDQYYKPNGSGNEEVKAFLYSPEMEYYNSAGYRQPTKNVSYQTLRRMARTPIIKTIITTRVDQVASFSEPSESEQEKGWMVRKKPKRRGGEKDKGDKKVIDYIENFILNGGEGVSKYDSDGFDSMLRAVAKDSLEVDQVCLELIPNNRGKLSRYVPVDGSTIQLVDSTFQNKNVLPKKNGYYPKYTQVWMGQPYTYFYPWEMTFGVRNKTTDIYSNGYGISELEDMVQLVTWLLYGTQYNGNFFSQGSNPKGFFSIEGTVAPSALADFKQMWRSTIAGVNNSHKVPVIESGGAKINWVPMQLNNKDMEFQLWLEFLISICSALFKIDPSECGFNLQNSSSQMFGQDGQKERLKHSQSKGLVPILKLLQRTFTKFIVEQIDENYEFIFTGVEQEDQIAALDMDVKKIQNGFISLEDGFKKYSGREFNPEKDTILNSTYLQLKTMEQQASGLDQGGIETEEPSGEENPFEKSLIKSLETIATQSRKLNN